MLGGMISAQVLCLNILGRERRQYRVLTTQFNQCLTANDPLLHFWLHCWLHSSEHGGNAVHIKVDGNQRLLFSLRTAVGTGLWDLNLSLLWRLFYIFYASQYFNYRYFYPIFLQFFLSLVGDAIHYYIRVHCISTAIIFHSIFVLFVLLKWMTIQYYMYIQ